MSGGRWSFVSGQQCFLNTVKANNSKYYWTGRITTTAGTVYEFDQNDMVKGSGYITSQCCGSTEIELGTVYAAEKETMRRYYSDVKNGRTAVGGFAIVVDVPGSNA